MIPKKIRARTGNADQLEVFPTESLARASPSANIAAQLWDLHETAVFDILAELRATDALLKASERGPS